ncbi:beta-lactamase superfamily domain-containing protein [Phycomyces nitens]|nr:beta-lactamase superfamily domain-containing protein [Phycomyces nitens]
MLPAILTAILVLVMTLYLCIQASYGTRLLESERRKGIVSRNHLKRPEERYASLKVAHRFVNPFNEWREVKWWETALFWMRRWKGNGIPKSQENLIAFSSQSTCLITIEGLAILTDPVFTRRSINEYLGPRRLRPVPCALEDIKENLDIVLVSHNHFDHLDSQVVTKLGNSVAWYVPLGLKYWFAERGVNNVIEMDWWQEAKIKLRPDITVACVPAMHWSGSRTPFDKNETLCGDTGYSSDIFKAVGSRYRPLSLAAIPIGSFEPELLMKHLHMGPSEAVKAHCDLGNPKVSVGIHWGTFMMSEEHYLAPPRALGQAWKAYKMECQERVATRDDSDHPIAPMDSSLDIIGNSRFVTTCVGETLWVA